MKAIHHLTSIRRLQQSLHNFDKVEFFDVMRKIKPHLTWEDYEAKWNDFQCRKAEYERLEVVGEA